MSWFDEQLRYRKEKDDESFADAIDSIAGAVMGRRLLEARDSRAAAQSAIEDILRYYRCRMKTDELPAGVDSLDEQLEYRMRPFGIMRRTVRLDKGWYRHAAGAMLGKLKSDGSAVALIPGRLSGYTYYDAKSEKRVRLNRRTEKLIESEAVCFYKPLPLRALTMADLLKFMAEQLNAADVGLYIGLAAVSALLGMISPMLTKWLFGSVLPSGSIRTLLALACFMVSFSVCQACFSAFRELINGRIGIKQDVAVRAAVMNRIMSLPAGFFKEHSSGELTQRAAYVRNLCSTLFSTIASTGLTSVFSLVYIAQVFTFSPALALPALLITLTSVLVSVLTARARVRVTREKMELEAKTSGMTYSMITGIRKIKLAGAEKRMFSRWAKQYAQEAALEYDPPGLIALSGTVSLAVSLLGTLILYYTAIRNGTGAADYYAFTTAYGMVSGAFMSLSVVAAAAANIRPSLEMARPIMETEPELSEGKQVVTSLRGGIELNNVSFRYDESMPPVIDGLSMKIRPGEYVAIVGATGCGKSTLMRLLLGFEKPQKGAIYYDRTDISRVDLKSLRRRIGTVMQDGRLFLGDIFSNITITAPQLTLRDAWEAAEIASVADDIRSMPMGMNTVISEGQGGISGGQRQRLLIARAVAGKPKILMLDEATSALDNVTQRKVCEAIDALKCTRIVIAHRLSTIRRADRIILLRDGKIAEEGTYDELIAKNGYFAELVERQRLDTVTA